MNTSELDQIITEGKPVPALEPLIAKIGRAAVRYAFLCLKGPFPAGESTIATDADWSYEYAVYVLHGRFPAGEAAIARNESNKAMYAKFLANVSHPENRMRRTTLPSCVEPDLLDEISAPKKESD